MDVERGVATMLSVDVDSLRRSTLFATFSAEISAVAIYGRLFSCARCVLGSIAPVFFFSSGLASTILSSGVVMHRSVINSRNILLGKLGLQSSSIFQLSCRTSTSWSLLQCLKSIAKVVYPLRHRCKMITLC